MRKTKTTATVLSLIAAALLALLITAMTGTTKSLSASRTATRSCASQPRRCS